MADAVDDQTLRLVQKAWNTAPALPALIVKPPQAGRLKSQPLPYVHAVCELDRREPAATGGIYYDRRKVTLRAYGKNADATAALKAMGDVFNINAALAFPAEDVNATTGLPRFMIWLPVDGNELKEDPDVKAGDDVWVGELVGVVRTVRR